MFNGARVYAVHCGIGKVNAALATLWLINEEKVAAFERRVIRAVKRRSLKLIIGGAKQTAKKRCV